MYVTFSLSFKVSFGPPSMIKCVYDNNILVFNPHFSRDTGASQWLSREVIRSHYINDSHPDVTLVNIMVTQPKEPRLYTCTVTVEGRAGVGTNSYRFDKKGSGTTMANITGKSRKMHNCNDHLVLFLY